MMKGLRRRTTAAIALLVGLAVASWSAPARGEAARWFPDRPVAWAEHDDADIPTVPQATHLQDIHTTLILRDSVAGEVDRILAANPRAPALDVNAIDEVPCSTWYCPRNHLRALTPEEAAAGPPGQGQAPLLPLRIVKGKDDGASPGFQVVDASGRKFMLKFDLGRQVGLSTGAEMIGERLFHAAGYNVPGSFRIDLRPEDLTLDPRATYRLFRVQKRPVTPARVRAVLDSVARTPDGRIRGVATPWIAGQVLGGFDMLGRRPDDPNDRIPHEHRRSLRATWLFFSWISELDPGSVNTLDTYVTENGRRFVRHYVIDFGATLGSFTLRNKGLHEGTEHIIEVGRTLEAIGTLGLYRRPFQEQRPEFEEAVLQYPSLGYFPAETYDPDEYRPRIKVPAHMRRTDRDLYWAAKVVTSFSNAQLGAIAAQAGMPARDGAYLEHALQVRRDIIGRRYLRAVTAVEAPTVVTGGAGDGGGTDRDRGGPSVCFDDLAVARGFASAFEVRYRVEISDGLDHRLRRDEIMAAGPRTCLFVPPLLAAPTESGYRIVQVTTHLTGGTGRPATNTCKAARIHLRWREAERRFVVVGLERDE